jgi:hypothetical protein
MKPDLRLYKTFRLERAAFLKLTSEKLVISVYLGRD